MRIRALAFVLVCIVTCAAQDPDPPMPSYTTEAGKACGRSCQSTASSCELGCGTLMRGATTSGQRSQCVLRCDAALAECYSTCE